MRSRRVQDTIGPTVNEYDISCPEAVESPEKNIVAERVAHPKPMTVNVTFVTGLYENGNGIHYYKENPNITAQQFSVFNLCTRIAAEWKKPSIESCPI
ncbi:hypothetical protein T265_02404 [Opisthorchis viverrini]|uniref:Uncharacterized protein n=1 Tax=Opisthorchis viverrini TaxID=6198 RepID=A0A075A6T2_OPIVI|nr:hypothetical protein T265_02404 [Opisthorchis viverrini]KER31355.1 hypothetical protein T265_02404 [Opisthorchis viverrini]